MSMSTAEMSLEKKADLLLQDPAALANHSCQAWQHLPREEVDAIHFLAEQAVETGKQSGDISARRLMLHRNRDRIAVIFDAEDDG